MKSANVHQAKTNLSKLLSAAAEGDDVFITRRGEGINRFKLVPVQSKPTKLFGAYKNKIKFASDYDEADREIAELFEESARRPL